MQQSRFLAQCEIGLVIVPWFILNAQLIKNAQVGAASALVVRFRFGVDSSYAEGGHSRSGFGILYCEADHPLLYLINHIVNRIVVHLDKYLGNYAVIYFVLAHILYMLL